MLEDQGKRPVEDELRRVSRKAFYRTRLQTVGWRLGMAFVLWGGVVVVILVALWFLPGWALYLPWVGSVMAVSLGVLAVSVWIRRPNLRAGAREIDHRFQLRDLVLTALELQEKPEGDEAWRQLQRQHALSAIGALDATAWRRAWPFQWPRFASLGVVVCLLAGSVFTYLYWVEKAWAGMELAARKAEADARAALVETIFQDWEDAKAEDEALAKLLEELRPMRDRMLQVSHEPKELFSELNRLEELLSAKQAALQAESLEPHAEAIASALEGVEGMSPLAAALRSKNFERAEKEARKVDEQLSAEGAQTPAGAMEAAESLEGVQKKVEKGGNGGMSQGLKQLAKGAREGQPKTMGEGMRRMGDGLKGEQTRRNELSRLKMQLMQLVECKECLTGNGSMTCSLSGKSGKNPGKDTNPNLFGDATQLNAMRTSEQITGEQGAEGESEITTVKSSEVVSEARRATTQLTFQEYEKLSHQAIGDEAIPLVHREAIKRYFEAIRPTEAR